MNAQARPARLNALITAALCIITFLVYLPALRHNFVEYDDQQYVMENLPVQAGLTWKGFMWAFGFHASNWHPLTWLSHMLDCQLYGLNPGGHHLTNVLLHVGSTVVLFLFLNRMTSAPWRSAAVAALFAWHPLHVESVAWIAERKDVLCAFFWMLTLYCYSRYVAKPNALRYTTTLGAFVLCLMAKPMGVTLPFVLLLLDYWPLRRTAERTTPSAEPDGAKQIKALSWPRLIWEKAPFFAMAIADCALTILAQDKAIVSTNGLSLSQRILHAAVAYVHYLSAAFVPRHLAVYYPYEIAAPMVSVVFSIVLIVIITLLAFKFSHPLPYLTVGWLWFLGTLVPAIGLMQVGDQAWADRYTYLPLIGVFIAVVWGAAEMIPQPKMSVVTACLLGVALLVATSVQLSYWKNTRTLFDHANKVTRRNYVAITVLGSLMAKDDKLDEAMKNYQAALRIEPGYPAAFFFMANALDQKGRPDEAVAEYEKALWYRPIAEQTHIFIGIILGKQNKNDEAAEHYKAALQINPDSPVAHNNLARILHTQGRFDEAIAHYQAALALDPRLSLAHNNLGILLLQKGRTDEGIKELREALRLDSGNNETQYNLAIALNHKEQWAEAAALFQKTVGSGSTDAKARYEFATALYHLQRTRDAMSQYAAALLLQPDFPDALDGLAWILATSANAEFRNGTEAVRMSEQACDLTARKNPDKLKTLAAAYAEAGNFEAAIKAASAAKELALNSNRKDLAELCRQMLEQFQLSKSWRVTNPS